MDANKLRAELHGLIDQADERLLNMVYELIQEDLSVDDELTNDQKELLDKRLNEHHSQEDSGSNWDDVKARIKSKL